MTYAVPAFDRPISRSGRNPTAGRAIAAVFGAGGSYSADVRHRLVHAQRLIGYQAALGFEGVMSDPFSAGVKMLRALNTSVRRTMAGPFHLVWAVVLYNGIVTASELPMISRKRAGEKFKYCPYLQPFPGGPEVKKTTKRLILAACVLSTAEVAMAAGPKTSIDTDVNNAKVVNVVATSPTGDTNYRCNYAWQITFTNGASGSDTCVADVPAGTNKAVVCTRQYDKRIIQTHILDATCKPI